MELQTELAGPVMSGVCPPHHWLIGTEMTDEGSVERWTCQRCGSVREREQKRRRFALQPAKRYVGDDALGGRYGYGGERVA